MKRVVFHEVTSRTLYLGNTCIDFNVTWRQIKKMFLFTLTGM